jgi:hypothetical protein
MKINKLWLVLWVLVGLLLASAACTPLGGDEGIVVGSSYRLPEGESLDHDLAVFGGSVLLEKDSRIRGSLAIFGGTVVVNGRIEGDLAAFGGVVSLEENAVIQGDVLTYGASVSTHEKAVIQGRVGSGRPPSRLPGMMPRAEWALGKGLDFVGSVFGALFQSLALGALGALAGLFVLRPLERVGDTLMGQPVSAGLMGVLTLVAVSGISVTLVITIIMIPLSIIGFMALGFGILFGWLALGLVTGERLAHLFNREWSGPVSAGVGTLALSLAANLLWIIPCVGWILPVTAGFVGLGAVAFTRFGVKVYPSGTVGPKTPASPASGVEIA